jgi:hypothetical protein
MSLSYDSFICFLISSFHTFELLMIIKASDRRCRLEMTVFFHFYY